MMHNRDDAQSNIVSGRSQPQKSRPSPWQRLVRYLIGSVALLLICMTVPALRAPASAAAPPGVWLMGTKVANRWEEGWFYNPDDGHTYSVSMELKSADLIVARIYSMFPIFGETRTLTRIPQATSEGWC